MGLAGQWRQFWLSRHRRRMPLLSGERMTIRIRYRILNARLAAGAVSGGGVDQAYDGWRVGSQFEFQQWVESGHSLKPPG
jgi:hypothetical protein